jgi:low temperature requirement protein LtrA
VVGPRASLGGAPTGLLDLVATSLQTYRLGADTRRHRIGLFGVAFCGLLMAIAVPQAYGTKACPSSSRWASQSSESGCPSPVSSIELRRGSCSPSARRSCSFALWWTYFADFSEAVGHAVITAPIHISAVRHLQYGHLAIATGIVMVAVGFQQMVATPKSHLTSTHLVLLYGGTALFVAAFVYMRWATLHVLRVARAVTVGLIMALLAIAVLVPGIVATVLLASAVLALNGFEGRFPRMSSLGAPVRPAVGSSGEQSS